MTTSDLNLTRKWLLYRYQISGLNLRDYIFLKKSDTFSCGASTHQEFERDLMSFPKPFLTTDIHSQKQVAQIGFQASKHATYRITPMSIKSYVITILVLKTLHDLWNYLNKWRLTQLRAELQAIRENQNNENETCSGIKCLSSR